MFESVEYESMAYLGFENVKVWVQDGELHYSKDVMRAEDNTDDAVSHMSVEEFSKRLDALGVRDWKEHYEPVGVMVLDGESWTVTYEDSDYKKYIKSGENEYPANWKKFLKLLSEVVGNLRIVV